MADKTTKVNLHKDGNVTISGNSRITEKEVEETRNAIIRDLDAVYHRIVKKMEPFQQAWASGPKLALAEAVYDGAKAGVSGWGEDFADFFKAETWQNMGHGVKNAAGDTWDLLSSNAIKTGKSIKESINGAIKDSDQLLNWSWYNHKYADMQNAIDAQVNAVIANAKSTVKTAEKDIEKAKKLYKYRQEILALPGAIAAGNPEPVQKFVETSLMDIDPELAKSIRYSPEFHQAIALLQDKDAGPAYITYAMLCYEAIPPNFYAYLATRGGSYLAIDLITTLILAFFTAGAALEARISLLIARIAASSKKVSKVIKAVEHAQAAFDAIISMIQDFFNIGKRLREYTKKLVASRNRSVAAKGGSKTEIAIKHKIHTRSKKCQCCGSTSHHTPHHGKGVIVYQ
ncbi:hypothetical protein [Chromobacterium phragmitis]|uniref:Uncharacterized protein n=1 Tax=Chromobacterium phragmitis TaxID=2202141 RepID=A0ABV0IRV2_9NEIS